MLVSSWVPSESDNQDDNGKNVVREAGSLREGQQIGYGFGYGFGGTEEQGLTFNQVDLVDVEGGLRAR